MSGDDFLQSILVPGIVWCEQVPGWHAPFTDRAKLMILAIAGQESDWQYRIQSGNGPAHSFWQMEKNGGVKGVLTHPASAAMAKAACEAAGVAPDAEDVWTVLGTMTGDNLGVAFCRLLLWTDPPTLPQVGDEDGAWDTYTRVWRPGAVSEGGERADEARDRWSDVYAKAMSVIQGGTP